MNANNRSPVRIPSYIFKYSKTVYEIDVFVLFCSYSYLLYAMIPSDLSVCFYIFYSKTNKTIINKYNCRKKGCQVSIYMFIIKLITMLSVA